MADRCDDGAERWETREEALLDLHLVCRSSVFFCPGTPCCGSLFFPFFVCSAVVFLLCLEGYGVKRSYGEHDCYLLFPLLCPFILVIPF